MSFDRPLRGGCHCGRNVYIIQFPKDANTREAQVLFNSHPPHRSSKATPLPAYLRVPLRWYHSMALPFFPDETNSQIHRVYTSPHEQHSMRHFCGFCGTPLSYWSEEPRSEADFIHLTLGSLSARDLVDLEDLGLLPESDDEGEGEGEGEGEASRDDGSGGGVAVTRGDISDQVAAATAGTELASVGKTVSGTVGTLPWLDTLVEGSRLGTLRRAKGRGMNRSGTVKVEWEVVEWIEDGTPAESPRKRKVDNVEGGAGMESMQT